MFRGRDRDTVVGSAATHKLIGRYLPILHTHPQQVTSTAGYTHYIGLTSTEYYTYTQGPRALHIQVKPTLLSVSCELVQNLALA